MSFTEKVIEKYSEISIHEVSINYTSFTLYSLKEIKRVNSLKTEIFIIGNEDLCGDLIGVDIKNESLPIYLIPSDSDFETTCIASSFDNFIQIMIKLQELSVGRDTPVKYEENQLSNHELNTFLEQVESENPGCDMEFWKDLFECE